ncbi:hypothetical protein [Mycobacterium sp. OTB74]|jgi:hypothetical protein|uniref:hypothetical protein n=1 Tax=Mycobacterium sp. OTB74 TaxID=1853452 RepID=UPI002476DAD0|nr:hypothetical protein [Mycobacterium sp. OTB74]MDH6247262.1 hypothetical protein [Mycobacterium sp. OTB74]
MATTIRNPLGLGVACTGAAIMALSTFLPLCEPTGRFRFVEQNTLVQHGGWWLLVCALAIGIAGYVTSTSTGSGKRWSNPIGACLLGAAYLVSVVFDTESRTLYPVGLDGTVDSSKGGIEAALGIAVYVGFVGVVVAFVGAILLTKPTASPAADTPPPAADTPPPAADGTPRRSAKCGQCGSKLYVKTTASKFRCPVCQRLNTARGADQNTSL